MQLGQRVRALSGTSAASRPKRAGSVSVRAAAAAKRDAKQRIVITGIGICSVHGNDPDVFYSKLLDGVSGISTIDRFDAKDFPTRFGGQIRNFDDEGMIDKKNARRYDDCIKYTMVSGKKALVMAGLEKERNSEGHKNLDLTRVGVLVGTGMGGLSVFQDGVSNLVSKGHKKISPFFIPYAITNMGGALLAIDQGFMGPNYSISTACATANYAFVAAANHIRNGDADVMIAGGSEAPIIPVGLGGFVACRALSTRNDEPQKASRPWDVDRDGFVMGEGAGVLVLESLEHATKRGAKIYGEYLGGAITCDAHHMTDPRADGLGVSTCIELALKDSRIAKEQVNYINCHATSTLVGDIAEVKAIKKVFTDTRHLKINGTKSMIGHCLGAAAGVEAIAAIKAIETGWVHPTLNQHNLIEEVQGIDTVPNEKKQHKITAAISNSFGFGGHNSVVAFAPFIE
ncbi:3-oxoacyl-[acyl-carrier-protein] synthase I, chloroplastic [Tetrabaena socialis]|uniref:3-oxoacyl-[acyl-carrier-protein] synthase n=1 Tax=Tetrabaena socialis TaxID=47790 RepID=A0A2J8A083_9CHLO|nr:3-oxoacyl-[acyl-carrier-protein] synthase I, chloroplastic [Tetrabaena socialis]|eukprot:PNH05925.1 3-oxoacyl-[acyl-carrier-protein] synthase I, chloroplastic [Tetrabaena socialis]